MSNDPPPPRGMPILSGPPPVVVGSACRKCSKEFNALWRRGHACGHCGHEFCSGCLEGQALMPRRSRSSQGPLAEIRGALGRQPQSTGYDVENVCAYCLSMLQVTAAPVQTLRTLPLKRLKDYLTAYDIPAIGVKEKEDLVEAAMKARNPSTGTLTPAHESYFRRKSVPGARRRAPPASGSSNNTTANAARPPPPPRSQGGYRPTGYPGPGPGMYHRPPLSRAEVEQYRQWYQEQYGRPPPPSEPQPQARPPPPRPQAQPQPQSQPRPQTRPAQPRPQAAKPTPKPTPKSPPPPVPTLMGLVPLPRSYLSSLSIGTLKAILYENHVRVDFSQVLEKSELVGRVAELVEDERKRLERQRREEEREEREAREAKERAERQERGEMSPGPSNGARGPDGDLIDLMDDADIAEAADGEETGKSDSSSDPKSRSPRSPPTGPQAEDRGLCVVCQDEEATLAVVDCGHLAMCAHCSDLVMATTKVCPMCRTRIVTPQRLIRIYRV